MNGIYFFGDFISGNMFGLVRSGTNWIVQGIPIPKHFISGYGEDESGRLYLVDYVFGKVYLVEDSGLAGPPVFNPPGGVIPNDTITITSSSPGATINYTTNGAIPTQSDQQVGSNGIVTVTSGTTLSARAFRADLQPSTVTTGTYILQAGTPVFSPRHGPITNGTLLSMTSSTTDSAIRYTLDASDPTASSTIFSTPIPINPTNLVSARAFKPGFSDSLVQRVSFYGAASLTNSFVLSGFLYFSWLSETGRNYQVQVSSNLVNWSDTGQPQTGTDGTLFFAAQANLSARYFRVRAY